MSIDIDVYIHNPDIVLTLISIGNKTQSIN